MIRITRSVVGCHHRKPSMTRDRLLRTDTTDEDTESPPRYPTRIFGLNPRSECLIYHTRAVQWDTITIYPATLGQRMAIRALRMLAIHGPCMADLHMVNLRSTIEGQATPLLELNIHKCSPVRARPATRS